MKSPVSESPVFGIYFQNENYYTGSYPCFYNPSEYDWVKAIEAQWKIMRDEITGYLESGEQLRGFTSPTSPGLSSPDAWKKIYFMNSLWLQYDNCRKFPKTWNIINQIPGVTMGAVLILEPHGHILPHSSESNVNIRCHLGIKIPAPLPECGIKVLDEERGWEEGKVMMFNDCHEHTVWNNTDQIRIIVAFDILQKEYAHQRTWRCAQYLGALTLRSLNTYVPLLLKSPQAAKRLYHFGLSAMWYFYLPIQSKFGLSH